MNRKYLESLLAFAKSGNMMNESVVKVIKLYNEKESVLEAFKELLLHAGYDPFMVQEVTMNDFNEIFNPIEGDIIRDRKSFASLFGKTPPPPKRKYPKPLYREQLHPKDMIASHRYRIKKPNKQR